MDEGYSASMSSLQRKTIQFYLKFFFFSYLSHVFSFKSVENKCDLLLFLKAAWLNPSLSVPQLPCSSLPRLALMAVAQTDPAVHSWAVGTQWFHCSLQLHLVLCP